MNLTRLKRHLYPITVNLMVVFLILGIVVTHFDFTAALQQRLEWMAYDLRLNATLPENTAVDPRIVIVDIDDKSLQAEGRWPWSRAKQAALVEQLFSNQAAVVGFDILFAEPEQTGTPVTRQGDNTENVVTPDYDELFAEHLIHRDVVLGYVFHDRPQAPIGRLPKPLTVSGNTTLQNASIPATQNYTANLPRLQEAARHGGFFNADMDADGMLRRAPLIMRHGAGIYASLPFELVRLFYGIDEIAVQTAPVGSLDAVEHISFGGYKIPTDGEGRVMIPYRGRFGSFVYVSATDVLHQQVKKAVLENAIVLIGTTAAGLYDLRSTPVQSNYPAVEVHATIISGLLDKNFPVQPSWAEGANFIIMLMVGVSLSILLPLYGMSPLRLMAVIVAVTALLIVFNTWMWSTHGLVLYIATPLALVFILALMNAAYGFVSEARERFQLKGMFGQYVPPELVEEMSRNPQNFGFQGDSREMTVLFSDIRGFTTISESLSAGDLKKLLNEFFTPMTRIIFNRRGTIDKYVGDMIMAFWGAPLPDDQHAAHAIDAALDMLAEVESLKPKFRSLGLPEINIGIGINTGVMNVGDMGSEFRRAYTVIGDAVNLASRLEGLTKFYGVSLIVGENTRRGQDKHVFQLLDRVNVKGKNQTVVLYQPLCRISAATDDLLAELALHEQALFFYFSQKWTAARAAFSTLQRQRPDKKLYSLFLERLDLLESLPQDSEWSGAFQHEHK